MKLFCLFLLSVFTSADSSLLLPVKTDNPHDTMMTFMEAMNDYRRGVEQENPRLKERIEEAIRCLAPAPTSALVSEKDKRAAAIFLKETIDRVIVLDPKKIPETYDQKRWRLKDTEVVLKPVKEGEREGEWLITYDTWSRAREFFKKVEAAPYLEGSGQGAGYQAPWMDQFFPPWSQQEVLNLKKWQWLGLLCSLLLGFLVKYLAEVVVRFLKLITETSGGSWRAEMVKAVEGPFGLLAATGFWYLCLVNLRFEGLLYTMLNVAIQLIFGGALIWVFYNTITVGRHFFMQLAKQSESPLDDQLVPFAEKTLKTVIVILGVLMILQNMGVNVFSVLAGLGLGGLAFALAAKDTAANLFGSIMILVDRPFKLGDWVIVNDVEGNVEEIGFRSTRVRTFYNSLISVPNSLMVTASIDNMGERKYRRVYEKLGLTYDTRSEKIEAFVEGIKKLILSHPHTRKDLYHVYFTGYRDSSLEVMLYFFIEASSWSLELKAKQEILLDIFKLAENLKVEFAFPTRTLHLKQEAGSLSHSENLL